MSQLFKPNIPKPKVVRMPSSNDPSVIAAGMRAREAARERKGRDSTILTDNLQRVNGSMGMLGR